MFQNGGEMPIVSLSCNVSKPEMDSAFFQVPIFVPEPVWDQTLNEHGLKVTQNV